MEKRRSLIPITFPRIPPYKLVGDYLTSKTFLNSLQFAKQEFDRPGLDPNLNLFATQKVFSKTNEELSRRREWSKKEHEKCDAQWQELYESELKFKDTFIKMSKFILSNYEKRQRAEKRRQADLKLRIKRTEDIAYLQKNIDLVTEAKSEFDANIRSLNRYQQYLNQVVGSTIDHDFVNADDLISRYEALVSTKNLLAKRQMDSLNELETARAKTGKLIEEYKFKILGLNNAVADLHSRYNTTFREALHWESVVLAIKKRCYEKYQEINEVKQSCWNIYLLMCRRKGEAVKISEDDCESQLNYIKKTLQELVALKSMRGQDFMQPTRRRHLRK